MEEPLTLLKIVAGSRGFGLERPESDTDVIEIVAATPKQLLGLADLPEWPHKPKGTDGDHTRWELRKFIRLALRGNPSALEVLFTPMKNLLICTDTGGDLRWLRHYFLDRNAIHNAYFGFATRQHMDMQRRGNASHGGAVPEGQEYNYKAAMHCVRLLLQEIAFHKTGTLFVDMCTQDIYDSYTYEDLIRLRDGEMSLNTALKWINTLMRESEQSVKASVIPDAPQQDKIEEWLVRTRLGMLLG